MASLILRRLIILVPLLAIVSFVLFSLVVLIPGDAATTLAGGGDASVADIERIRSELGLDRPFLVQYGSWLWGVLHLDFGVSLDSGTPVAAELLARLPITLSLVVATMIVTIPLALGLGIWSGLRAGHGEDRAVLAGTSLAIAMPPFWVALLLVSLFAVVLRWLPPAGYTPFSEDPAGWLHRIVLPALALAAFPVAVLVRQLRGGLVDTMHKAFIRTAWAKGGSPRQVVLGHALKSAAMPAVTVLGLQVATLLGGSVVIEQVFTIPGIGSYLLNAINTQDLPAIQAVALVFVVTNVLVSLVVDLTYGVLNPKVRTS
ncbi:ABC transporter permease [Pseudonocardia pini]|uniref:ABC transporter permease n=1 Tax=Pseudonocardia pini TaxID=2758030 RepID=UPI0015F03955|nr:ABC transporter permease [Pseudonocardia pini]